MEKNAAINSTDVRPITRKDLLMLDPALIIADESFNVRQDYGDIDELKNSIIENGVKQPLRGFREKDGEKFRLTDGFRRYTAVMKAISEGTLIKKVPFILEERGYTNEQRLVDMFVLNSGKRLTPLEEGDLFSRLEAYGWARKDIARKIGKTEAHVSNMILVSKAPKFVKNQILENVMSATTASEIMRSAKDEDRQKEIIEEAKENAKKEGKDRITSKHVSVISDKKNERKVSHIVQLLKSVQKDIAGNDNERIETFNNVVMYLEQEVTLRELKNYLTYRTTSIK